MFEMTSLVLGDIVLDSLTPSVNAPLNIILYNIIL